MPIFCLSGFDYPDLEKLRGLQLPDDADLIASLDSALSELGDIPEDGIDEHLVLHVRALWVGMCSPEGLVKDLIDANTNMDGQSHFWAVFGALGDYYGFLLTRFLSGNPIAFASLLTDPGFAIPDTSTDRDDDGLRLARSLQADGRTPSPDQLPELIEAKANITRTWARQSAELQIRAFDMMISSLVIPHIMFQWSIGAAEVEGLDGDPEAGIHKHLGKLIERLQQVDGFLRTMMENQLRSLLYYGEQIYAERALARSESETDNAFSEKWLKELALLGARDSRMKTKYGAKQVERRFERHVALLLQTLGFITVPAISGEVAADLLCIGKEGDTSYSFLVDAKSSKRPYALPKADQRAIAEYVDATKKSLADLPKLAFVLLIGHGPAGTVAGKLGALEASVGVPIRFISAGDLAGLRQRLPGPLRAALFQQILLESEPVLASQELSKLPTKHSDLEQTYTEFVRGLRKAALL